MLFNNAGAGFATRIEKLEPQQFEDHIALHLFSTVNAMRLALPIMRKQGFGRIINTCSRGAEGPGPGGSAYAAAKAGIWAVTRTAAIECAGADILVNCLIPGPTNSSIWGRDMPKLQPPSATIPTARLLATLPANSPVSGKTYWDEKEYELFVDASAVSAKVLASARKGVRPRSTEESVNAEADSQAESRSRL